MEKGPKKEFYQKHLFNLKLGASEFLKKLLFEVELRIPTSNDLFRGLSALHPDKCLSQAAQVPFNALPSQGLMSDPD